MRATVELLKALGFRKASKEELRNGAATYVYPYIKRKHPVQGEYFPVQITATGVEGLRLCDITAQIRVQSEAHTRDRILRFIEGIL